jgi:hypothetical protein
MKTVSRKRKSGNEKGGPEGAREAFVTALRLAVTVVTKKRTLPASESTYAG